MNFVHCAEQVARKLFVCLLLVSALVGQVQPQTWTELAPIGSPPNPVYAPKAVHYDAANNRLIVFFPGNPPFNGNPPGNGNEVWVLTNANGLGGTPQWIKLLPTGTPPFSNTLESVVYDSATNRLIVYGGCFTNCAPALSNVFTLSNANGLGGTPNWTQSAVTNPQARVAHSAVYDSATNRMITFGGGLAFSGTDQNDVRILSNANGVSAPSTWSLLAATGALPPIREEHSAIYDSTSNRMTIFGGHNLITCCPHVISSYSDVWMLSNANGQGGAAAWTQLIPTGYAPSARGGHSAVYDSANNRMLVYGGYKFDQANQQNIPLGGLWELSYANGLGGTPSWTPLLQLGVSPGPRFYHTTAFDQAHQRMILFGGRDINDTPSNRVWVFDFTPPSCVPPPSNMVSWWTGDGNANDANGSNHGSSLNGATFATGLVGQAFSFNGIGDYVHVPNTPSLTIANAFTIDFWFKPAENYDASSSSAPAFFSKGFFNSIGIANHDGRFEIRGPVPRAYSATNNWAAGTWYHAAVTFDGASYKIYINGVLEGGIASNHSILNNVDDVALGIIPSLAATSDFNGLLDELELHNRALTFEEIRAVFNAGSAGKCKNRAPVAVCQSVTVAAGANCLANASINNGSYDPDGDAISVIQTPAGPYPLGNTQVTLTVTDSKGAVSQCTANVTVIDGTAPMLTLKPSLSLWPPNHKYQTVTIAHMVQAISDNCSMLTLNQVVIEQVTSDEPDNGLGDGDTATDIVIAPDCRSVKLRAERAGGGNGRVYSVRLRVKDGSGNIFRQEFKVKVPPNQSGSGAVEDTPASTVVSSCSSS